MAPCATAVAARARARAASAGHVRGPLMIYMNDDDYTQGGKIVVDIARRRTRLFSLLKKNFFFERKRRICKRAADQALNLSIFFFVFFPKKGSSSRPKGEARETRKLPALRPRIALSSAPGAAAAARKGQNEINTAVTLNGFLTREIAVF